MLLFNPSGLLETERQSALERLRMSFRNQLVLGSTAFLLGALGGQKVAEAGRAANKLSAGGQLEALGDGLFGLLHGEKRFNTPERRV